MTRTELIRILTEKQAQLTLVDVELIVKCMIERMNQALAADERIEIRGFGSFSLHKHPPRTGRNPKTGDSVILPERRVPHFKSGKELRERVNASQAKYPITD